jgi:uncharacterized protein YcnI
MPIDDDENDDESVAFMTAGDPVEIGLVEPLVAGQDEPDDEYDDDLLKQEVAE